MAKIFGTHSSVIASLPVAATDNQAPPALAMVHPSTPPNSRSPGEVWSLKNPPTVPAPDFSWHSHGGPPQAPSTPTHKPRATHRSARAPAPAPARSSTLVVPAVVKKVKADQKSQTEKVSTNQAEEAEEAARLAKLKAQTESQER